MRTPEQDAYFQAEMTTGPFVCPCCVKHGVEMCREHCPRTADELEYDERGRLVAKQVGRK